MRAAALPLIVALLASSASAASAPRRLSSPSSSSSTQHSSSSASNSVKTLKCEDEGKPVSHLFGRSAPPPQKSCSSVGVVLANERARFSFEVARGRTVACELNALSGDADLEVSPPAHEGGPGPKSSREVREENGETIEKNQNHHDPLFFFRKRKKKEGKSKQGREPTLNPSHPQKKTHTQGLWHRPRRLLRPRGLPRRSRHLRRGGFRLRRRDQLRAPLCRRQRAGLDGALARSDSSEGGPRPVLRPRPFVLLVPCPAGLAGGRRGRRGRAVWRPSQRVRQRRTPHDAVAGR